MYICIYVRLEWAEGKEDDEHSLFRGKLDRVRGKLDRDTGKIHKMPKADTEDD